MLGLVDKRKMMMLGGLDYITAYSLLQTKSTWNKGATTPHLG